MPLKSSFPATSVAPSVPSSSSIVSPVHAPLKTVHVLAASASPGCKYTRTSPYTGKNAP